MYRQGDLLFVPVKKIKGKLQKDKVIEIGEATGHAHVLEKGKVFKNGREKFVMLETTDTVIHPEHSPLELPKGNYKVVRQREFRPRNRPQTVVD